LGLAWQGKVNTYGKILTFLYKFIYILAYEDVLRHKSDKEVNSTPAKCY